VNRSEDRDIAKGVVARPRVFLSHASEDHELAERIARDLMARGIDTFFDGWEIRSGDGIRQKIDAGLGACTHFVVLVTPVSLTKRWVNAEIDAGYREKIEGRCRFIALRVGVEPAALPPLLGGLHSPRLDVCRFDEDMRTLVGDIHGVSRRPPLGAVPVFADRIVPSEAGVSPHAAQVARYFVAHSEHGLSNDRTVDAAALCESLGLTKDELLDAVDELESEDCAILHEYAGGRAVSPTATLFVRFDRYWTDHDAEQDALRVATYLLDHRNGSAASPTVAQHFGWSTRRMNPAVQFLLMHGLIEDDPSMAWPWLKYHFRANRSLRRWLQQR